MPDLRAWRHGGVNFAPVAFLDAFELAASLRQKMGLFRPGGHGEKVLPIRGARANADDQDDDLGFVLYKEVARWPEIKAMLGRVKRLGEQRGGVEFGRIFLELLPPATCLPWARDESAYASRFQRAHLALRTNPAAMMYAGTEAMHLLPGALTLTLNRHLPSSAINLGDWPRVHLVVDFQARLAGDEPQA